MKLNSHYRINGSDFKRKEEKKHVSACATWSLLVHKQQQRPS